MNPALLLLEGSLGGGFELLKFSILILISFLLFLNETKGGGPHFKNYPFFFAPLFLFSRPHLLTVPSMSHRTNGIITPTIAPPATSSTLLPVLAPNEPTRIAHPNQDVDTNSSPRSSAAMHLRATSSGVCPPSPSSRILVTAGLIAFSAASEGEKMVAGKRV